MDWLTHEELLDLERLQKLSPGSDLDKVVAWQAAVDHLPRMLGEIRESRERSASHDQRVTELLAANNREVERRRAAEAEVTELQCRTCDRRLIEQAGPAPKSVDGK